MVLSFALSKGLGRAVTGVLREFARMADTQGDALQAMHRLSHLMMLSTWAMGMLRDLLSVPAVRDNVIAMCQAASRRAAKVQVAPTPKGPSVGKAGGASGAARRASARGGGSSDEEGEEEEKEEPIASLLGPDLQQLTSMLASLSGVPFWCRAPDAAPWHLQPMTELQAARLIQRRFRMMIHLRKTKVRGQACWAWAGGACL